MRYVMKQKWLAMGEDFVIRDENGRDVYVVDGRVFSIGDQLALRDMAGNELAFIKQKVFAWGPTYEVYRDGTLQAVVKKHLFSFLSQKFTVDVEGPDDLEAAGDLFGMEYDFSRGGTRVAAVSRRWFSLADTYGVEVADGEDDVLILAAAVVIDLVRADSERSSNSSSDD